MSVFLEILKCILCCAEDDNQDSRRYEALQTTRETPSSSRFNEKLTFDSGSSAKQSSTHAESVYNVVTKSNSSTKYLPVSSCSPPTSSYRPPQPETIASISRTTISRLKVQVPADKNPIYSGSEKPTPVLPNLPNQQTKANFTEVQKTTSPSFVAPEVSSRSSPSSKKLQASASSGKAILVPDLSLTQCLSGKDGKPTYTIPKDVKDLFEKDEVPEVLKGPLSKSTYKDYFAALLYAEDYYLEKWSKFNLSNITFKLQAPHSKERDIIFQESWFSQTSEKDDKTFFRFEISSSLKERPFLLSRDFVFAIPSGSNMKPFQGNIYRVEKSTTVLVKFDKEFHRQHHSTRKYDVSFGFNRVCLKRCHQAIAAASNELFRNFIFPDYDFRRSILSLTPPFCNHNLDLDQRSAVSHVLNCQGPPPYLVNGPLCATRDIFELSRTGLVVKEAVLDIYQRSPKHRILLCAPINSTCDLLNKKLNKYMPDSDIFRANAAFRDKDDVPEDILPSCLYKYQDEYFAVPKFEELQKFRVVISTYMSSFRLRNVGITPGHFSHVFLLDASSATEPEVMVALSSLADESTTVIVTGAPGNRPGWVRSSVARTRGLRISYFERINLRDPYYSDDPMFITNL
ncbi:probable RNA helicase SDE3 [Mercurialis annua]|uniref:probable RNA helicase SDE3 n=1 Tax=Mercurialis annua TaxID=3986 RepID=UPI002160C243|nr:probable RNA helicase SDE3 [Mercurialis annua]